MTSSIRILTIFALVAIVAVNAKPFGFGGPRHRPPPPPPCGIPPFLAELPADAQAKITEIWKDYQTGAKCYNEQGLTREILDALPKELQKSLHKRPPFLAGLPKETLAKFDAIFQDKSIPHPKKIEQIDALAEKTLSGENLKKFQEFKAKKEQEKKEYEEKKGKLSENAKEVDAKIEELRKQKFELIESLDEKTREELFDLWETRPGPHGPPPPRH
ncbi:unnamed protein product [Caenorhabditis angaria]|uniref:SXP/RAL-2 family protein Ani s 5-like cation-binding domain-containing protein n=1 Tax=Caenorhabditis angaria TaxID=860376 RepID=A0A9P1IRB7_9PELO|nr:unnamed protein product [Caenorhabditis angaria]